MVRDEAVELVATHRVDKLVAQAARLLGELRRSGSRYRDLVQVARVYQEMGNALASQLYETLTRETACVRGCDTCCHIPSEIAGFHPDRTFSMSVLDSIILIEEYERIKQDDIALPTRTRASADEARRTRDMVRCPHLSSSGECAIYNIRPVACKIWFSAELGMCLKNREASYPGGVNRWTDASVQLYRKLGEPFVTLVTEIAPQLPFKGDFLEILEEIAMFDERALFDMLRMKVDAQELNTWRPFEPENSSVGRS